MDNGYRTQDAQIGRRDYLKLTGAAAAGLAGCIGGEDELPDGFAHNRDVTGTLYENILSEGSRGMEETVDTALRSVEDGTRYELHADLRTDPQGPYADLEQALETDLEDVQGDIGGALAQMTFWTVVLNQGPENVLDLEGNVSEDERSEVYPDVFGGELQNREEYTEAFDGVQYEVTGADAGRIRTDVTGDHYAAARELAENHGPFLGLLGIAEGIIYPNSDPSLETER